MRAPPRQHLPKSFAALPTCSECNGAVMSLVCTETDHPGFELQTLRCPNCGSVLRRMIDPIDGQAPRTLKKRFRTPWAAIVNLWLKAKEK
jgi:hypothetical protein